MAERFCLHLAPLDVSLMTDENDGAVMPLVYVVVHMQERGEVMYEEAEMRAEGQDAKFNALLTRLYHGAASIVSEIEEDRVLLGSSPMASSSRQSSAHVHLQNGGRLFFRHPVEGGDYMLSVTIPAGVWRWLGPITLQILLATAVRGYEIAVSVAAVASVPTYYPLRDRLTESSDAVEDAVRSRIRRVMEFVVFLNECEHRETASSAALLHGGQEVVVVTRRLCHDRPSLIRKNSRLSRTLQQLLWSATSYSDYVSLSGAVSSGGMRDGYKRLVVTAAAVWYHGEPLFSSGSSDDYETYLLPAAIVAYADRCLASREATGVQQPITVKCISMHVENPRIGSRTAGYVKQHGNVEENTAAITAAFVSLGGWIVTLRMEAALNAFTGAPMPHIVSGVTNLITRKLEIPQFEAFVRLPTVEKLMGVSQTTASTTMTASNTSFACILRAVRHLGLFAHPCGDAVHLTTAFRDVCLYRYRKTVTSAVEGNEWSLWPQHAQRAVQSLVGLTALTFRRRRRKTCGGIDRSAPFSLLRGCDSVLVLLAAPVYSPVPKVVFFLAEMEPQGIPAAEGLRAFATWVLSKAL